MLRILPVAAAVTMLGLAPLHGQIDPGLLAGLEARDIGPAAMSGRVAAIDAPASNPNLLYVGAATGGLWKSTDGAVTFEPIFDDQPVAAIGAVAVFQPSPDVVWVGTGEGNPRNSASVGNGVYRSLDGGVTWSHLGLEKSERIHRILLHPTDRDVAWVAAMGPTWGDGGERGVYRTRDGGETWTLVLAGDNPTTGAGDLVADPTNPDKLVAAMWDHRRWPWFFRSGGPGSGLFITHDGGDTWRRMTPEDGLPEGNLGRVGLAIAPSNPSRIYALVEAEGDHNLFLRSDDGGQSWRTAAKSGEQRIGNRPFYYADLRVDPQDPNRIYSLWSNVSMSEDGGATWEVIVPFRRAHPDHHAMWISPSDPNLVYLGTDGGVYVSRDRAGTWRFVRNLPLAQFYHLRVDQQTPFNVYGGLQDNGSWRGPSAVWENGGIRDYHWREVNFGDGFDVVPDPENPDRGWAMSQGGFLVEWDLSTGMRKARRPEAPVGEPGLRFNWSAAIAIDPFDSGILYFGSQFVHRSEDRGETWTVISPDLTSNDPERQKQAESGGLTPDVTDAENFTSLTALAPSPVARGTLWAGSDDGRLHVTRDGGETWTRVDDNVPGVPEGTWIPHVEPSRFDGASAFVVFDDHRRSNWTPYVYRTDDHGATWTRLADGDGDGVRGYALAIAQDPVDRDLLFLGTEFGLWFSVDGGGAWHPFHHGVPTVSVMDLTVHPRDHALVLGTHGRGIFIVDHVHPLRGLDAETLASPLHLFEIPEAIQYKVAQTAGSRFPGQGEFRGENKPYGAALYFSLGGDDLPHPDEAEERKRKQAMRDAEQSDSPKEGEEGDDAPKAGAEPKVKITVRDANGGQIRELEAPAVSGINRLVWDLRRDGFEQPPGSGDGGFFGNGGPLVPPGTYTVTVELGDHSAEGTVEVLGDPRMSIDPGQRRDRWRAQVQVGELQELVADAVGRIQTARSDVQTILAKLAEDDDAEGADAGDGEGDAETKTLPQRGRELVQALDAMERRLWSPPSTKGIIADTHVYALIRRARRMLGSEWGTPTPTQSLYLERARAAVADLLPEVNRLFAEDVATFREEVRERPPMLLEEASPLALPSDLQ
ncbi:MAG: hypothetical protein AAGD06_20305 [Acidobacteriota bacterium]